MWALHVWAYYRVHACLYRALLYTAFRPRSARTNCCCGARRGPLAAESALPGTGVTSSGTAVEAAEASVHRLRPALQLAHVAAAVAPRGAVCWEGEAGLG